MIRTVPELASLRGQKILAVFPHPDDEAYGCAGTLARAESAVLYCMTRGEASSMGPERGLSPDEVAALREQRLLDVGAILGLDGFIAGDWPDSGMAYCPLDAMARSIDLVLAAYEPRVVIGHDPRGVNAHPDHVATHWALRHALLGHPEIRFAMLAYTRDVVEAVKPRLLFATPEEDIDVIVHLTEKERDMKEACLRVHEALITLRDDMPELIRRPAIERYDVLGESYVPPRDFF